VLAADGTVDDWKALVSQDKDGDARMGVWPGTTVRSTGTSSPEASIRV